MNGSIGSDNQSFNNTGGNNNVNKKEENEIKLSLGIDSKQLVDSSSFSSTSSCIFQSNVLYKNKSYVATLTETEFTLHTEQNTTNNKSKKIHLTISLEHICAVHDLTTFKKLKTCKQQTFGFLLFVFIPKDRKKIIYEFYPEKNILNLKWIYLLRCLVFELPIQTKLLDENEDKVNQLKDLIDPFGNNRKLLIFLNPFSGRKKGAKLFEKFIKPILDLAHLSYVVIKTEKQNHAYDYCLTSDTLGTEFTDVIGMGGDGIIYEIINGIANRSDWKNIFRKIRIGHIPGGTSNALASTSGSQIKQGEPADPEMAAFLISRGFHQPMDLMSCFQSNNKRYFSFLSVTFGAIADIDIGTENVRWMGSARNLYGALKVMMNKKYYKGRVKYLQEVTGLEKKNSWRHVKHNEKRYSAFQEHQNEDESSEERSLDCPLLRKYFSEELKRLAPNYLAESNKSTQSVKEDNYKLSEIEDNFLLFMGVNIPHISHDFMASPMAHLHDGYVDLVFVKENISRGNFLNLLVSAENGNYILDDAVDLTKVKAFYLSPIDTGSFVVVDGENVDYSDILVEVHSSICNLLTL
ncbi:hypothetical protein ABK040_002952 [Willaertia magna]